MIEVHEDELCCRRFVMVANGGYYNEVFVCLRPAGHAPPCQVESEDNDET